MWSAWCILGPCATEGANWKHISPHVLLSAGLIFSVCTWINSKLGLICQFLLFTFHQWLNLLWRKLHNRLIKESLKTLGWSHRHDAFQGFCFGKHSCVVTCTTPQWLHPFIYLKKYAMKLRYIVVVHHTYTNKETCMSWILFSILCFLYI